MLGFVLMLAGKPIFETLQFPPGIALCQWMSQNSGMTFMGLLMCNMAASNLIATNAFEVHTPLLSTPTSPTMMCCQVSIDGRLVHSKLDSGQLPRLHDLVGMVKQASSAYPVNAM